jgi:hypothetical protein
VLKAAFTLTQGTPKYFDVMADSGKTTMRAFCAECGSRLFGEPGSAPDVVTIRVGSLDDPSRFWPSLDIYTASGSCTCSARIIEMDLSGGTHLV